MQRKKIVYSSLDANRYQKELQSRPKTKTKKRKQVKNNLDVQLVSTARIYLRQLKLIPKHQIQSLFKSTRFPYKEYQSITSKRIAAERYKVQDQQEKQEKQEKQIKQVKRQQKQSNKKRPTSKKKNYRYEKKLQLKLFKDRYNLRDSSFIKSTRNIYNFEQKPQKQQTSRNLKSRQQKQENNNLFQKSRKQLFYFQIPKQYQNNRFSQLQKAYLSQRKIIKQSLKPSLENQNKNMSLSPKKNQISNIKSNQSFQTFNTLQSNQRILIRSFKGFIINERNQMISKFLLEKGWRKLSENSQRYTLKWTYNDSIKDYQILRAAEKQSRQMYFNHMNNNKLVKKDDFNNIVKQMKNKGINTQSFIPETFIIGAQRTQFLQSFQFRTIFTCLHKHYQYIEHKKQKILYEDSKTLNSLQDFFQFITNLTDKQAEDKITGCNQFQQFIVNIPLLYNLLICCLSKWVNQKNQVQYTTKFTQKFNGLCHDKNIIQSFNVINRADLQFQQYHKIRYSSNKRKQNINNKTKQISIINGHLKMVKTFMTPCKIFIEAVELFYQYFNICFNEKIKGGLRNVWIIKPCTGSKGSGIEIVDKTDRINQITQTGSTRIVQKYIQNVWTLKPSALNKLDNQSIEQFKNLVNKKFDMRQWVLLTTSGSYIFSSFYIRVCSEQYNFDCLTNQYSHLSNFSINRQNYSNPKQSVISEIQFLCLMQKLGKLEEFMASRKKISQKIKLLTDEALLKCQKITGTFEVVGFDIIIDEQFNPWIIQCNMSPACNLRTDWLREMKTCMMMGTLKIVLGQNILEAGTFYNSQQYKWNQLSTFRVKRKQKNIKKQDMYLGQKTTQVKSTNNKQNQIESQKFNFL